MDWDALIQKVVDGINRLKNVSGIMNPYKQFPISIANGASETYYYNHNYARLLTLSISTGVTWRFGSSGTPSDIVGAGIGYKLPSTVDRVTITNNSGGALTGVLGLAVGEINDDRLNVSGTVTTSEISGATFTDTANVAVNTVTTTQVLAASSTRKTAIISNLAANAGVIKVGASTAGASRGVEVPLGGSAVLDTSGAIYVYNPQASTVNIGLAEIST